MNRINTFNNIGFKWVGIIIFQKAKIKYYNIHTIPKSVSIVIKMNRHQFEIKAKSVLEF